MADISQEISAFQNAVYGEDVRSAMVSLANKLNQATIDCVDDVGEATALVNTAYSIRGLLNNTNDLNLVSDVGSYYILSSSKPSNYPFNFNSIVFVITASTFCVQLVYSISSPKVCYSRVSNAYALSDHWSEWYTVQDSVNDLSDRIDSLVSVPMTDGGYINSANIVVSTGSYSYSDYIPVYCGKCHIKTKFGDSACIILYDENKRMHSNISNGSGTNLYDQVIDIPQNVKFIRISNNISYSPIKPIVSMLTDYNLYSISKMILTNGLINIKAGHDPNSNYLNKATCLENSYVDGGLTAQGRVSRYNGFYATDFIEFEEDTLYYINKIYWKYYAFYNENKEYISGADNSSSAVSLTNPFTIPSGAKYGRFTLINGLDNAWIYTVNAKPSEYIEYYPITVKKAIEVPQDINLGTYCDYREFDICTFRKGICIGDSLTEGTFNYQQNGSIAHYINYTSKSYPTYLQAMTGIEITNKGHGGMSTVQWYNAEKNNDLSGYDFAIIQLGVNDFQSGQTEWPQESHDAMENIITKLQNENNNIIIFVATIIPATSYGSRDHISQGIRDLVEELNDDHVVLLDIAVHGHTKDRSDYNCGHLSAYGYWRLAKDYIAYISYLMSIDSIGLYSEIQFIGTDYQYHS